MADFRPFVILLISFHLVFAVSVDGDVADKDTLRLVQVIIRHGARAPISAYPNDPYKNQSIYWPEGWTQMTKPGFKQQLELGQYLRKRYDGFLPSKYSNYEFLAQSSDVDRAIQSAEANLAGLFHLESSEASLNASNDITWQAVPIHTIPENIDIWINDKAICPRYIHLLDDFYMNDPVMKAYNEENAEFLHFISLQSGLPDGIKVTEVFQVQDALRTQRFHNLVLPDWATEDVLQKLDHFKALSFGWKVQTKEMKRLRAGSLIGKLLDNFKVKASVSDGLEPEDSPFQDQEPFRKMHFFSGHDTTISGVLATWGVYNTLIPPFASAVMIELHKLPGTKEPNVEIFYRNDTTKVPFRLQIPECGSPCFLSNLIEISKEYIPTDWDKECQEVNLLKAVSLDTDAISDGSQFSGPSFLADLVGIAGVAVVIGAGIGSAMYVALKRWQVSHGRAANHVFGADVNNYQALA